MAGRKRVSDGLFSQGKMTPTHKTMPSETGVPANASPTTQTAGAGPGTGEQPFPEPTASPEPTAVDESLLPKLIPFHSLARCGDEIWIENEGQVYRLRRTKQGKLILTK